MFEIFWCGSSSFVDVPMLCHLSKTMGNIVRNVTVANKTARSKRYNNTVGTLAKEDTHRLVLHSSRGLGLFCFCVRFVLTTMTYDFVFVFSSSKSKVRYVVRRRKKHSKSCREARARARAARAAHARIDHPKNFEIQRTGTCTSS